MILAFDRLAFLFSYRKQRWKRTCLLEDAFRKFLLHLESILKGLCTMAGSKPRKFSKVGDVEKCRFLVRERSEYY